MQSIASREVDTLLSIHTNVPISMLLKMYTEVT
jgi:hypothetical protein